MGPTVTLVIEHGRAVAPTPDPVAEALLTAVAIGVMGWSSIRLGWHLGRQRTTTRRAP